MGLPQEGPFVLRSPRTCELKERTLRILGDHLIHCILIPFYFFSLANADVLKAMVADNSVCDPER